MEQMNDMKTQVKKDIGDIIKENSVLRQEILEVSSELKNLKDRHIDLQARSMRDNLVFTGLKENERENIEDVLQDFIKSTLEIDTEIHFDREHRIGKKVHGKSRPIIAKFTNYKEKEMVRKSASSALKKLGNDK